jgi:uncharacterized membrane protein YdjX (TVP38/TMEM64 family)
MNIIRRINASSGTLVVSAICSPSGIQADRQCGFLVTKRFGATDNTISDGQFVSSARPAKSSPSIWKWVVGAVLVIALIVGWCFLPVKEWSGSFHTWIKDLGAWGMLIFGVVYIVATVLLVPGSVLTVVAGLAFGVAIGFLVVVVSATIGATLAFLIARYLVHKRVEALLARRPKFKAVNAAVSEAGWKIVGLLRLSPLVPFNLQNYFYGITDVKLIQYVPATFVGIMPGTLLYVYLGAAGNAASGKGGGPLQWTFFAVGLIATVAVAVLVTKKAKEKLKQYGVGNGGGNSKK